MGSNHDRRWRHHSHRMRKSVANKLQPMIDEQDGKCYYCKQRIVCHRSYDPDDIIVLDEWVYLKKERQLVKKASVEHIKPIFYGGTNRYDNLAAACVQCNQERSDIDRTRDIEMQQRVMFARDEAIRQFRHKPIMQMKRGIFV